MIIPYGTQQIDAADIRAVTSALKSSHLTQGPAVERFEEAFARYCGARYAVAVSSGTAGLHLAALAAGLRAGDEAITSPMTFVATANSVVYCGASPKLVDIDRDTLGLSPETAKKSITARTRAVLPVHYAGQPCRVPAKKYFSKRDDFFVIEDAAHALGAEVKSGNQWKKIGSCENSDMAVFSFHPVKHITTGEGGMITTHRLDLYKKLLLLRTHGIERDATKFRHCEQKSNPWYYEMTHLGFNYRITDIQCALGLAQLKRLPSFLKRRRELAAYYSQKLKNIEGLQVPIEVYGTRSAFHLYAIRIDFKRLGKTRAHMMKELRARGIGTQVHYIPVYRQPFYEDRWGAVAKNFPETESFYAEALSIPMYGSLGDAQAAKVVRELKIVLNGPSR